jgi:hypothetical protein
VDVQKPTARPLRSAFSLSGKPPSCHHHRAPMHCPADFTEHSRGGQLNHLNFCRLVTSRERCVLVTVSCSNVSGR